MADARWCVFLTVFSWIISLSRFVIQDGDVTIIFFYPSFVFMNIFRLRDMARISEKWFNHKSTCIIKKSIFLTDLTSPFISQILGCSEICNSMNSYHDVIKENKITNYFTSNDHYYISFEINLIWSEYRAGRLKITFAPKPYRRFHHRTKSSTPTKTFRIQQKKISPANSSESTAKLPPKTKTNPKPETVRLTEKRTSPSPKSVVAYKTRDAHWLFVGIASRAAIDATHTHAHAHESARECVRAAE